MGQSGASRNKFIGLTILTALLLALGSGVVSAGAASNGPPSRSLLVRTASDRNLNCRTASTASDWLSFFEVPRMPAVLSCATVVSVQGVGLFGPREFADLDGSIDGTPLRPYRSLHQRVVANPAGAVLADTVVSLPGTGIELRQRDRYLHGEVVDTTIAVDNKGGALRRVVVYRTGDCFPGADPGFGITGSGAVGCEQAVQRGIVARPTPGPQYIRWRSTRGSARGAVAPVAELRAAIAAGRSFANTCVCSGAADIAAGLSWTLELGPLSRRTVSHDLTLSTGVGREPMHITASTSDRSGARGLTAEVTTARRPMPGMTVEFVIGTVTQCRTITNAAGLATCPWDGPFPEFVAVSPGDVEHLPAEGRFSPPVPPPPTGLEDYPDCARFDHGALLGGIVSGGDAHHEWVGVTTLAPPCPGVEYRVLADGSVIGSILGDRRSVNLVDEPVSGFAAFFIDTEFGLAAPGCHRVESIDTRTGVVVDTYPGIGDDVTCISEVLGQKFR